MQPTPVDFDIIDAKTTTELAEKVRKQIQTGWFLHGPMMIDRSPTGSGGPTFLQPLAKIEMRPLSFGEPNRVQPVSGIIQG